MKKALGILLLAVLMAAGCVEPVVVTCVLQRTVEGYVHQDTPVQYLVYFYARRPSESEYRVIDDASNCVFV